MECCDTAEEITECSIGFSVLKWSVVTLYYMWHSWRYNRVTHLFFCIIEVERCDRAEEVTEWSIVFFCVIEMECWWHGWRGDQVKHWFFCVIEMECCDVAEEVTEWSLPRHIDWIHPTVCFGLFVAMKNLSSSPLLSCVEIKTDEHKQDVLVFVHIFFFGGGGVMLDPTQYWSMHLCGKLSSLRADSIFLHERASVFFSPDLWFSLSNSLGLAPSLVEVPAERV